MMLAAQTSAAGAGGHPVWHLLIVAVASVAVFTGLKASEWWRAHLRQDRGGDVGARLASTIRRGRPWARPKSPLVVWVALASAGCSAIHAAVGPAHFHEFTAFGVFFVVASALQAAWALLVIRRADRMLLAIGAVGNAVVLALWALTRTVGLPLGPEIWRPEAVAASDVLASVLELAVIVGATWLFLNFSAKLAPKSNEACMRLR